MRFVWVFVPVLVGLSVWHILTEPTGVPITVRILIDHSDSLDAFQSETLKRKVREKIQTLDRNWPHTLLFSPVKGTETPSAASAGISTLTVPRREIICRPLNIPNCGQRWWNNTGKQDWAKFLDSLDVTADNVILQGSTDRSYILRSLNMPWEDNVCEKDCPLWVISDLLENSTLCNMRLNTYTNIPNFPELDPCIENTWGYPDADTTSIFWLKRCLQEGGR